MGIEVEMRKLVQQFRRCRFESLGQSFLTPPDGTPGNLPTAAKNKQ